MARKEACASEDDFFSSRTLLLVSTDLSDRNSAAAFSHVKGWNLLVAPNVSAVAGWRHSARITVVLYDADTPDVSWQDDVLALRETQRPAFLIVLSSSRNEINRAELIALGGWDLVRKPVAPHALAKAVDSCLRLVVDVDRAADDGVPKVRSLRFERRTNKR